MLRWPNTHCICRWQGRCQNEFEKIGSRYLIVRLVFTNAPTNSTHETGPLLLRSCPAVTTVKSLIKVQLFYHDPEFGGMIEASEPWTAVMVCWRKLCKPDKTFIC